METQKEKRLRLWKARQEAEGHDVSGVTTLEQAAHFFDNKPAPPVVHEEQEEPKPEKPRKPKEV